MPGIQELNNFKILITDGSINQMGVESEPYEAVNGVVGLFFVIYSIKYERT